MYPCFDIRAKREHPLDEIPPAGGFCSIFRTIGCIGDSLSAGEFVSRGFDGETEYHDCYEHAWGAYLERLCGSKVHIFARGGMSAREFVESYGRECGFLDADKRCQAYIIALGVNDFYHHRVSPECFMTDLKQIIHSIRSMVADAPIFLMTMPRDHRSEQMPNCGEIHAEILSKIVAEMPQIYIIDLRRYAPLFDEAFRNMYFMGGHMTAAGYLLMGQMVASYIDYIIREHPENFREAGFIGTGLHYESTCG